jgi:hypothetical protein
VHIGELVAAQAVPFAWADGTETTLVLSPRPSTPTGCASEDGGHLVQYPDCVVAVLEMGGSACKDGLIALLPTSTAARDYDGGLVDFSVRHAFAWPSGQLLGSEGRLSIIVAPPSACDSEEPDVRVTLAEGRIPATAAPSEQATRATAVA